MTNKEYKAAWYQKNKERLANKQRLYHEQNKEVLSAKQKEYDKIHRKQRNKNHADWVQRNLDKHAAYQAKRRAYKLYATPKWLTKEQLDLMYELYKEAQKSNEELHVDHIVPLKGKNVSGLHVPWNLQLLPKTVNIKKGNRL